MVLHCYKKIKKKIRDVSLAKQLIFAITLLMFCLLTAVIGFTYRRTIQVINQQQAASNLEILNLKRSNFENYFSQLQDYSMLLRNNTRLYGIFSSDKPLDYLDTTYINSALRDTFYSRNDIVSYKLYILNSKTCYSVTKADFNIRYSTFDSTADIDFFQTTKSAKNYLYYQPEQSGSGRLMTICRVFINIINQHPLAFVEITVDDSFLKNLSGDGSGMSSVLGMLDQNNAFYYSGDGGVLNRSSLSQIVPDLGAGEGHGNFSVNIGDKDYLTVYSDSQDGRWRFLSLIPQDILQKPVEQTKNLSLILALTAFFVSVGIIFVMIEIQLRPLQTLARQMQSVGQGDFKTKVDSGGNAEVNNLSRQFNLMTTHVDELIQKNYIADLNEKTARLKALEAQVDPHFLYNTLQAISTEAVLSGQDTIRRMVEALASMLRYSVQEKNLVSVKTEMKHVQEYLFLQSARFEDRLAYGIHVDPDSEGMLIPKISIQTLVENSIKHGLESSGEQIRIIIGVLVAGRELCISVSDDGRGMTPERLAEVRSMTEPDKADGSGIGLTNLAARLKIIYNGCASLSVASELGSGTKVEMTIPLPKEGDSDLSVSDHR
jgi:Predicted signal transduction protein with a C-terminal ATPase domain